MFFKHLHLCLIHCVPCSWSKLYCTSFISVDVKPDYNSSFQDNSSHYLLSARISVIFLFLQDFFNCVCARACARINWKIKHWWCKELILKSACEIFAFSNIVCHNKENDNKLGLTSFVQNEYWHHKSIFFFHSGYKTLEWCYLTSFIIIDFSKMYRPLGSSLFYYSCSTSNISRLLKGPFYIVRTKEITLFKDKSRGLIVSIQSCALNWVIIFISGDYLY